MSVIARWTIRLWATCPDCGDVVDLTKEPDFWLDHNEKDITQGRELSVYCPECMHNFEVVTE